MITCIRSQTGCCWGCQAAEPQSGAIEGWKLSLFDLGNPAKLQEVARIHLGGWGSDSPANRHHHAFTSLAVNGNTLTKVALPVMLNFPEGYPRTGLHQFEVDHRTRTLKHVGEFSPKPMTNNGWYWNETDRSILIDNKVYYYHAGNFYQGEWGKAH
ncbi:MAG: beta-propeller domain-containing protein [Thiolinea sp.]